MYASSQKPRMTIFFVLAIWLLQPAAKAFVVPAQRGGRTKLPTKTAQQSCRHSARPRDKVLLAAQPTGDEDLPGVADSRLAGWRVTSTVEDNSYDTEIAASGSSSEVSEDDSTEPRCGDVVEYPLSELVKGEADDGREKGVAVIVSINKHRNDAWKLPADILDKAELQVLCPDLDGGEEGAWMVDELEVCAFAKLGEMKVLKAEFNGALDKWKRWSIDDTLSEGCGARDAEWEYDMI